jgi:hypothetical protein
LESLTIKSRKLINPSIKDSLLRSTGELKELLLLLKTKDNVVLAGLLVLLLLMKVIKFNSKINLILSISVSNNSLTALTFLPMRITVAMEDTELELWSTSRTLDKQLLLTIHILLRMEHVLFKEDHLDLSALLRDTDVMKLKKSSSEDPWLLELMLVTGTCTKAEFSITAPRTLTTPSSSLVQASQHGQSKIVGDQPGENQVIFVLLREIPALFAKDHLLQFDPTHLIITIINL